MAQHSHQHSCQSLQGKYHTGTGSAASAQARSPLDHEDSLTKLSSGERGSPGRMTMGGDPEGASTLMLLPPCLGPRQVNTSSTHSGSTGCMCGDGTGVIVQQWKHMETTCVSYLTFIVDSHTIITWANMVGRLGIRMHGVLHAPSNVDSASEYSVELSISRSTSLTATARSTKGRVENAWLGNTGRHALARAKRIGRPRMRKPSRRLRLYQSFGYRIPVHGTRPESV